MARMTLNFASALRILCAVALLCVGFAHKPPVIGSATPPGIPASEIAQYTLPDGTVPTLCLPTSGDDSHDHGSGCEACRLTASIMLPPPPVTAGERIAMPIDAFVPVRDEAFHRQLFPPNAAPRAPPVSGLVA